MVLKKYLFTLLCFASFNAYAGGFGKKTKVMTPSGNVPISTLEEGDLVYSFDNEGVIVEREVLNKKSHEEVCLRISSNGKDLILSPNQGVFYEDEFIPASRLKVGMEFEFDGDKVRIDKIKETEPQKVVSIVVDEFHNFILSDGLLVHNGITKMIKSSFAPGGPGRLCFQGAAESLPDAVTAGATLYVIAPPATKTGAALSGGVIVLGNGCMHKMWSGKSDQAVDSFCDEFCTIM